MSSELVNIGKYRFNIIDNISQTDDGIIYSRNFKIGGDYTDCVNVSITYDEYNKPVSAKFPTLVYDEKCSLTSELDRGEGTIIMIKTLLKYIKNKIPEINEFVFEDKSNIECVIVTPPCALGGTSAECGTDEEKHQKRHRKRGTYARPLVLYYFSIAFNHVTWYEKHFNAYQKNLIIHRAYRARVKELLEKKVMKPSFNDFLRISQPPMKYLDELKILYEKSETYGDFFNSIPKNDRCRLTREWIPTFMEYYLDSVFSNKDWVIDVRKMDEKNMQYNETRKQGGNRIIKRNKYYCPAGKIRLSFEQKDVGI
jgi:hypothetical protein